MLPLVETILQRAVAFPLTVSPPPVPLCFASCSNFLNEVGRKVAICSFSPSGFEAVHTPTFIVLISILRKASRKICQAC